MNDELTKIPSTALEQAAQEGMDEFLQVFVDAIYASIGGELNNETIGRLNADQVTLLAYHILREEVMDGGFVQLIHNGYGPFFFRNPFAKAVREMGLRDLYKLMNKARKLYGATHEQLEQDCLEEEFMALFEKFPQYDELDDEFVENEEEWTSLMAHYVDEHIENFATII
ncbi:MAG: DMP19 family protein [Prevotella sp.]|nr:DMP19 family protein [Prevotella sp.]